jgi:acyl-CoA synthetase (AMP-forming)/AMP-acid ligase II
VPTRQERVLLIGENSFFWMASYLGTLRAGLVCVPLAPSTSPQTLEYIIRTTEATLALVDERVASRGRHSFGNVPIVTDRDFESLGSSDDANHPFPLVSRADLAALMFTSGSTGTPRGVMISHGNIIANTSSIIESLQLTRSDSMMTVLPFYYCFGTSLLHTHLRVGGSLVVDSRFMYVETILERLASSRCTGFAGVPSHFQILLRSSALRRRHFPHLRYVQQAGGQLPPAQIDALREALPHAQVFVMYGQTEATARLSCLPSDLVDVKRGSIGKGIPGVILRVVNAAGEDVRPGEVGEIRARGDNIAIGYWGDPDESARTFRNGWLHTGDLATVDEDGFTYIVGRDKDFLKCRGERVSCQAIEAALLEFVELSEAAVIGIPDDVLGEAIKAFVVPCDGATVDLVSRVQSFCKQRMPAHLVPREVVVMQDLPKNSAGKVIKRQLKAL